jgi:hypothetical protein
VFQPGTQHLMRGTPLSSDPLLGCDVEIHSVNGIAYRGRVIGIRNHAELGDLFELGSEHDPSYRRLVYVVDRPVQIRHIER